MCRGAARILISSPVSHTGVTKHGVARRDKAERGLMLCIRCSAPCAQLHLQVPCELEIKYSETAPSFTATLFTVAN